MKKYKILEEQQDPAYKAEMGDVVVANMRVSCDRE
jgi:hypothetical protein